MDIPDLAFFFVYCGVQGMLMKSAAKICIKFSMRMRVRVVLAFSSFKETDLSNRMCSPTTGEKLRVVTPPWSYPMIPRLFIGGPLSSTRFAAES